MKPDSSDAGTNALVLAREGEGEGGREREREGGNLLPFC